jgi:putative ubiquitin-RnfH superfamily antitoxin RatB of RatAB toxin-antitoxin module
MASVEAATLMKVQVSYSPRPREVECVELELPAGSRLADALLASGLIELHRMGPIEGLQVGVWGRAATLEAPLREADRVEVYRGLQVDPKEARRQRYRRQKR